MTGHKTISSYELTMRLVTRRPLITDKA